MTCFNPEQCEHRPKTNQRSSLVFLLALPLSQSVLGLQSKQSKRQRKNLSTTSDCSTSTAPTLRASSPRLNFPQPSCAASSLPATHHCWCLLLFLPSFSLSLQSFPPAGTKVPCAPACGVSPALSLTFPGNGTKGRETWRNLLHVRSRPHRDVGYTPPAWSSWKTLRKNTLQQDVGERLCPYEILPLVIISRSR